MPGECAVWDITASFDRNSKELITEILKKIGKKWTFQIEKGHNTGYVHYQIRVSLYKKKTFNMMKAWLDELDMEGYHLSQTSTNATKGPPFYVMKEDTRIEGPWSDTDPQARPMTKTATKVEENGLRPWQNDLLMEADGYDDRHIWCVIDKRGNNGKGALCKWMYSKGYAMIVPPFQKMEDIVQFCISHPSKLYLIDMPRAMKKKHLYDMYSGIEALKDGYLYDKRYKGTFHLIDEPNIIVFTNTQPKMRYLSADRWNLRCVNEDQTLGVFRYPVRPIAP